VLDVGCGLGLDYELYQKHDLKVDYVGLDACKGFIEYNKKLHPEAQWLWGKSYNLPFEDKSFDLVTCRHVLEHLKEAEPTIREMCRVGKSVAIIWLKTPGEREIIRLTQKGFYKNMYCRPDLKKLIKDLGFTITTRDFQYPKKIHQLWHLKPLT
jgi:ubiquinone/menaquinone biosynthesis C-methylase UbiE